jgi:ssDNA-binding Zn-finger/Zn-ribbon topoisomerase 1
VKIPRSELSRAFCPDHDQALLAIADITMEQGLDNHVDPLCPYYIECKPLAWQDESAHCVLYVVISQEGDVHNTQELGQHSMYDITCPECGRLNRDELIERVEEVMHEPARTDR